MKCGGIFVHTMKHCTTEAQALSVTHARISLPLYTWVFSMYIAVCVCVCVCAFVPVCVSVSVDVNVLVHMWV